MWCCWDLIWIFRGDKCESFGVFSLGEKFKHNGSIFWLKTKSLYESLYVRKLFGATAYDNFTGHLKEITDDYEDFFHASKHALWMCVFHQATQLSWAKQQYMHAKWIKGISLVSFPPSHLLSYMTLSQLHCEKGMHIFICQLTQWKIHAHVHSYIYFLDVFLSVYFSIWEHVLYNTTDLLTQFKIL